MMLNCIQKQVYPIKIIKGKWREYEFQKSTALTQLEEQIYDNFEYCCVGDPTNGQFLFFFSTINSFLCHAN